MPNSFHKLYVHHVSAVKHRDCLILPSFEKMLYAYITGIIQNIGQTPIAVNGMPDHIHIAARLRSDMAPSIFVNKIKSNSSRWINENGFLDKKFAWQSGGATFSVGENYVGLVKRYIQNQKRHHQEVGFRLEYLKILHDHGIDPESEFLPEFFD